MKYCVHCGNELLEEAVICPKCGCQTADKPIATKARKSVGKRWVFDLLTMINAIVVGTILVLANILTIWASWTAGFVFNIIGIIFSMSLIAMTIVSFVLGEKRPEQRNSFIGSIVISSCVFIDFFVWMLLVASAL